MLLRIFSGSACLVGVITLRWQNYPPGTESPSRCSCALPRWELWSILGCFAGIGRVVLPWEGGMAHVPEVGRVFLSREGGMVG